MKILGIDPGIGRLGFGQVVVQSSKFKVQSYGCFETHKEREQREQMYQKYQSENTGDDDGRRLYEIHCFLKKLIEKEKPDEVAVESLFFAQNVKTAMMVSQARGAILLTIAQAGLPAFSYTPLQVKQALTGYGRAEKKQVQKMVQVVLGMKEVPKQDDAADALAVAVCHSFSRKLSKLMK